MTRSKVLIGAVVILSAITAAIWSMTAQPKADTLQSASPTPVAKATDYALTSFTGKVEKSAPSYQKVAPYLLRGNASSTLLETADKSVEAQLDAALASGQSVTIQGYEKAEDGYVVIVAVTFGE